MRHWTDKVTRGVGAVVAMALVACGGAPFVALDEAVFLVDGGITGADAGATAADAAAFDAFTPFDAALDAEPDAAETPDSSPGTKDAGKPACATEAPVQQACGGPSGPIVSSPLSTCLQVNSKAGASTEVQSTPSQCASWCDYTCACLVDAGICGSMTFASCLADPDGVINVGCNE